MPPATLDRLRIAQIVPVIEIDDPSSASELIAALLAGGITSAEITLRTPEAIAAIGLVAGTADFTIGAGTVLTPEQVDQCADAGAEYVVSPGLDPEVVERALTRGILALPGIATATELQLARRLGLEAVKFFPAAQLGGVRTIAALAAPFPEMAVMPSGGITADNFVEFLACPTVFAAGGSWMATRQMIRDRDFDAIAEASRRTMHTIPRQQL